MSKKFIGLFGSIVGLIGISLSFKYTKDIIKINNEFQQKDSIQPSLACEQNDNHYKNKHETCHICEQFYKIF